MTSHRVILCNCLGEEYVTRVADTAHTRTPRIARRKEKKKKKKRQARWWRAAEEEK
jgi:hypothetical protein